MDIHTLLIFCLYTFYDSFGKVPEMSSLEGDIELAIAHWKNAYPFHLSQLVEQVDKIANWLSLVETWNKKIDLTAAKSRVDLIELALLDAWICAQFIPLNARVVDVGPGFGAPGLAVLLLRPDVTMTFVEPLHKRVAFLRNVMGCLGLEKRLTVVADKGESLAGKAVFQVAISRATLAPADWLSLGIKLAAGGSVFLFLAQEDAPDSPLHYTRHLTDYATRLGAKRTLAHFAYDALAT